jgi:hypothetical protein
MDTKKFPVFKFQEDGITVRKVMEWLTEHPIDDIKRCTRGIVVDFFVYDQNNHMIDETQIWVRPALESDKRDIEKCSALLPQNDIFIVPRNDHDAPIDHISYRIGCDFEIFIKNMQKIFAIKELEVTVRPLGMWTPMVIKKFFTGHVHFQRICTLRQRDYQELYEDDPILEIVPDEYEYVEDFDAFATEAWLEFQIAHHRNEPIFKLEKCIIEIDKMKLSYPCAWTKVCEPSCFEHFVILVRNMIRAKKIK